MLKRKLGFNLNIIVMLQESGTEHPGVVVPVRGILNKPHHVSPKPSGLETKFWK